MTQSKQQRGCRIQVPGLAATGGGKQPAFRTAREPWGVLQFSSRHQPPRRGRGGGGSGTGGGGGSRKSFSISGAFLNSPFHSEHFEYTQVGVKFGFTTHNK